MTKNSFAKLAEEVASLRERGVESSLYAPPPGPERDVRRFRGWGEVRNGDKRRALRAGRNVQFAAAVSMEFKGWLTYEAAANGQSMASLLYDMRAAYLMLRGGRTAFCSLIQNR
jgi:hypothetical protein